jgi:hypothetical protein
MNTNCAIVVIVDKISHCGMLGILIIKRKLTNDAMVGLLKKQNSSVNLIQRIMEDFHCFIENIR